MSRTPATRALLNQRHAGNLVADQETTVASARKIVEVAEAAGDQATADLGVRRIEIHEKNAWMLRSHLE